MIERRFYKPDKNEFRAYTEDDKQVIVGYAAKFNIESRLIAEGGKVFTEILLPGAFSERTNDDTIYTFNHALNVFARTVNETLLLEEDEIGLRFTAYLNGTTGAQDLYKMIERGDIFENSFAFTVDKTGQEWSRSSNGDNIRKISRISRLFDVSSVTYAAYPNTEVSVVRGVNEFIEKIEPVKINPEPYKDLARLLKIKSEL